MWTPRELWHSFVSVLSDAGVSLEQISRLVGHSGTTVIELVYQHQLRPVIQTGATEISCPARTVDKQIDKQSGGREKPQARTGPVTRCSRVGLSGLEPLTSALSGRFRTPGHAKRRQRVAVNS